MSYSDNAFVAFKFKGNYEIGLSEHLLDLFFLSKVTDNQCKALTQNTKTKNFIDIYAPSMNCDISLKEVKLP